MKYCTVCGKQISRNTKSGLCARCSFDSRKTGINCKCNYCGKDIYVMKCEYERNKHNFCSTKCLHTFAKSVSGFRVRKVNVNSFSKEEINKRAKASSALRHAVRDNKIEVGKCLLCNKKIVHGHHYDYDKPLDVIWLCEDHHYSLHKGINILKLIHEKLPEGDAKEYFKEYNNIFS